MYGELRAIARRLTHRRRGDVTWQPTELVHEAFLHLAGQREVRWEGRAHFFGIAARAMRQVLADHARAKGARKRGGGRTLVTLTESIGASTPAGVGVIEIDEALTALARVDARAAEVAEKKIFGGLTVGELAHVLGVSERTVDGDWQFARMWLGRELAAGA